MKIIFRLIESLLLIVIVSCGSRATTEQKQGESLINIELLNIDTVNAEIVLNQEKIYFELKYVGRTKYLAKWGKSSNDTFQDTIQVLESGNPQLMALANKSIYIRQGCGTACSFAYILPFKANAKAKYYLYPLAVDLKNNLIAYNGEETESLAVVESYFTGEREFLKADFLLGPYPGHSIDSISLSGDEVFIEWRNSNGELLKQKFEINVK